MNNEEIELVRGVIEAISSLSKSMRALGNNDADSHMGAIENLSFEISNAGDKIACSLETVAEAIASIGEALHNWNNTEK